MKHATVEVSIDHQVQLLSEAIGSKEEFEAAMTRLSLLMTKKLNLRPTDVHKVVTNLRDMEQQITTKFTEVHGGKTLSVEAAQEVSESFRRNAIDRVLDGKGI